MVFLALLIAQTEMLFDPVTGYRVARYRGTVAEAPPGVPRIDDVTAATLHEKRTAVFIDVTPAAGATHNGIRGTWLLAEPHDTIPGAHWFPEAGRGDASPAVTSWFFDGVERLTHHDRRRTVVVFCLADCWMSWNASYRLVRAGYRRVLWYANGADGWREAGRSLSSARPERSVSDPGRRRIDRAIPK